MRKIFRNKTKYTFNYFLVCSHKPLNSKKKILLLLLFLLSQSPKGPSDQLIVWINQSGRKQSRTFDRCTKGRVNIYRGCSRWTRTKTHTYVAQVRILIAGVYISFTCTFQPGLRYRDDYRGEFGVDNKIYHLMARRAGYQRRRITNEHAVTVTLAWPPQSRPLIMATLPNDARRADFGRINYNYGPWKRHVIHR